MVGCATLRPPEFYLKIRDGEYKSMHIQKCLRGLTEQYKDEIENQAS